MHRYILLISLINYNLLCKSIYSNIFAMKRVIEIVKLITRPATQMHI